MCELHNLILIGYENGLIDIFNESTQEVMAVVDIFEKLTSISLNNKAMSLKIKPKPCFLKIKQRCG